jgi:DNA polymerase-3 subunit gamma/tau
MSESGNSGPQGGSYQVLARKYRPTSFDELIGQEPMVRTLRNAFAAGRIPHAWMLTGVRGVGKTTTARILARGLNFQREDESGDKSGGPTVDFSETGIHCQAIMEGRHPDVLEMDAASHTGIDDVRDIIDSARYVPVAAPYKVYIVDEVHMLSKAAFNGLLKTLEEPPAHVKFIFATTEIRKVPVTVLSRCQRFDLRRIGSEELIAHLGAIAQKEGITAEPDALQAIARASEGSVRDALSILDQAIAHGGGAISADAVHDMLGLADRARTIDLFDHVMRGDAGAALAELQDQFDTGAEPQVVLADLAEFTHFVTRLKIAPDAAAQAAVSETERTRGRAMAEKLSMRVLSQTWQMLLKGLAETTQAARPLAAADMVLVRLCHAASLPTPDEAVRMLRNDPGEGAGKGGEGGGAAPETATPAKAIRAEPAGEALPRGNPGNLGVATQPAYQPSEATADPEPVPANQPRLRHFDDLVALARKKRDRLMVFALERHIRPVRFEPGQIEIKLTPDAEKELPHRLAAILREWTGKRWIVAVSDGEGAATVHERRQADKQNQIETVKADPLVASALSHFPGAEIVAVRDQNGAGGDDDNDDTDEKT